MPERPAGHPPRVAITIDVEYPDRRAGEADLAPLLQLAAEMHTPVTVFVEGRWARARRDDLDAGLAVAPPGTVVGLHSYSHVDFRRLTVAGVRAEIADNRSALEPSATPAPLLRLPYGAGAGSPSVRRGAALAGVEIVGWDAGSRDWDLETSDRDSLALLDPVLETGGIVLFHSWPLRTPHLLGEFIKRGLSTGVEFSVEEPTDDSLRPSSCTPASSTPPR